MATMIVIRRGKSPRSICRLCFMEREQSLPIFGPDSSPLDEWIGHLISLKIADIPNAPASLCLECKTTLEDFESFIEMCRTNDSVFNEIFLPNDQATEGSNLPNVPVEHKVLGLAENETFVKDPTLPLDPGTTVEYTKVDVDSMNMEVDHESDDSMQSMTEEDNSGSLKKKGRCGICKLSVDDIAEHALTHTEAFSCHLCPKIFGRMSLLKMHIYRHKLPKKFVCKVCGKGFKTVLDLKNHMNIHTRERPFKCKQCDASYRTRTSLIRHEKSHKLMKYHCQNCDTRFAKKNQMEHHKRLVVRDKYWCEVCKKNFTTCNLLLFHRQSEHH